MRSSGRKRKCREKRGGGTVREGMGDRTGRGNGGTTSQRFAGSTGSRRMSTTEPRRARVGPTGAGTNGSSWPAGRNRRMDTGG